jgi:hypothetical protein
VLGAVRARLKTSVKDAVTGPAGVMMVLSQETVALLGVLVLVKVVVRV